MTVNRVRVMAGLGWVFLIAGPVHGDGAADDVRTFSEGQSRLAQADFTGALEAFAAAAKADPQNPQYRASFSLLRRVLEMRDRLETETNAEKWESVARGLRTYYHENNVYSEALALDRRTHARLNTAESAMLLAETELVLGMNAEAAELLGGLDDQAGTPRTRILQGIALARQGRPADARSVVQGLKLPEDAGPGLLFEWARLRTLLGEQEEALGALVRCFELTPPSRLEGIRTHARQAPDLRPLTELPEFARVMETQSTVPESKCSLGASCAKCPSRAACGGETASTTSDKAGR
ncbi:MAG: hypothetical protein V2A79_04860 [Planctomycetota bacterium]